MDRAEVRPDLIRWARERAGLPLEALSRRFPHLKDWEQGRQKPSLRQLQDYARATMAPLGYFFLPYPPQERLPIPDFRTVGDAPLRAPSPNLLDTIHAMQRRQAWLREERIEQGAEPLPFIGSMSLAAAPAEVAEAMRRELDIGPDWANKHHTWSDALRALMTRIEARGIMLVCNGVVGNNTHRPLDPREFRGFVLVDRYAPLIFVNAADGKAAQMFTLAHELAHLWVGQDAIIDLRDMQPAEAAVERFCNQAAAEFLIPEREMRTAWAESEPGGAVYAAIARRFKVSELVAARRALDLKLIEQNAFADFYRRYLEQQRPADHSSGGGNFYNTQRQRVGRVFATAVYRAVREGRLLYHEAYDLTGLYGTSFDRFMSRLEQGGP